MKQTDLKVGDCILLNVGSWANTPVIISDRRPVGLPSTWLFNRPESAMNYGDFVVIEHYSTHPDPTPRCTFWCKPFHSCDQCKKAKRTRNSAGTDIIPLTRKNYDRWDAIEAEQVKQAKDKYGVRYSDVRLEVAQAKDTPTEPVHDVIDGIAYEQIRKIYQDLQQERWNGSPLTPKQKDWARMDWSASVHVKQKLDKEKEKYQITCEGDEYE